MSSACSSIGAGCSIFQHMHTLWHATGWRLLRIIDLLRISSGCLASWTRMKRCSKLPWVWSALNLSKCTVVHFIPFLHYLYNIRLGVQYIWLSRVRDSLSRPIGTALSQVLICYVEVGHLVPGLGIVLSSRCARICASAFSAADVALQLLWSLAGGWRNYHLVEVRWGILILNSLHGWILLARNTTLLLLSDLRLEANRRWIAGSVLTVEELLIHGIAVPIWSIDWIHWV